MLFLMCFYRRFDRKWFKDYVAILEQAGNYPIERSFCANSILYKIHREFKNSDYIMLSLWFSNKDNNFTVEIFAKALYENKNGELGNSLVASLKAKNGIWMTGGYLVAHDYERSNGERVIALRLFNKDYIYKSIMVRMFNFKDLKC